MPITEVYINQMKFNVLPCASKDGDFWEAVNKGAWEPETFKFMENYIRPDKVYTEIGGWIGSTALAAYAYNPQKIYTIEADPANYQVLKHNINKNLAWDKIVAFNACLTDKTKANKVVMFGKSNADKPTSSNHRLDNGTRIPVKTIDALPFLKKNCELSKGGVHNWDIEGSEKYLIPTLAYLSKRDSVILLSMHAPYWGKNKEQITNSFMPIFDKYKILCPFNYTEIGKKELKDRLMDNSINEKELDLRGQFFSIILKTKGR